MSTVMHTLSAGIERGEHAAELTLNVIVRFVDEGGGVSPYYVAECIEMPGCVSDGETEEAAKHNLQEAMQACLTVLFEDCVRKLHSARAMPDLRGITSQARLQVDTEPQLVYA